MPSCRWDQCVAMTPFHGGSKHDHPLLMAVCAICTRLGWDAHLAHPSAKEDELRGDCALSGSSASQGIRKTTGADLMPEPLPIRPERLGAAGAFALVLCPVTFSTDLTLILPALSLHSKHTMRSWQTDRISASVTQRGHVPGSKAPSWLGSPPACRNVRSS